MKRLSPLLLALALSAGSPLLAGTPLPVSSNIDPQVMQSDREFLKSQSQGAPAAAENTPPSDLPDPIAAQPESKPARVVPKRAPAPAPTSRIVTRDHVYTSDPYEAPRFSTRDRTIVLGGPADEDPDFVTPDEAPSGITYIRRDRYDDDDRFSPGEEIHRKVSHIRRFIHRLLPF